jgi:hypothetical protein
MRRTKTTRVVWLFGVLSLLAMFSVYDPFRGTIHSEESLPVEIDYEHSEWANAIRLSNPFWADNRTLGWLEMHYFHQERHPPIRKCAWFIGR